MTVLQRWKARRLYARRRKVLAATHALSAGRFPYQPYERVNRLYRDWQPVLPGWLAGIVPDGLLPDLRSRLRQFTIQSSYAWLVQEATQVCHRTDHALVLPLPAAARMTFAAPGGRVRSLRSWAIFCLAAVTQFRVALSHFRRLLRHAASDLTPGDRPYAVMANMPASMIPATRAGVDAGIAGWLHAASPLAGRFDEVWFSAPANHAGLTAWPDAGIALRSASSPMPALDKPGRARFALQGGFYLLRAFLALPFGQWQPAMLARDILDLMYFRQVAPARRAVAYVFMQSDQANRPLWAAQAHRDGIPTPLVFYASSYGLFHYNDAAVPPAQKHPTLVANTWPECWFQTEPVRAAMSGMLEHNPRTVNVGAFSVQDSGEPLPALPDRALLVFDVEPAHQMLSLAEAGYISPFLSEEIVVAFWQGLFEAARALGLVLVHKPKRPMYRIREWRYLRLLEEGRREGILVSLDPTVSALRLLPQAQASVSLPFTSIGDLAFFLGTPSAYFLPRNGVVAPEQYSMGMPCLIGTAALEAWLSQQFSDNQKAVSHG